MNKAKIAPRTYLVRGNILDFNGDAIICPCFTDLGYLKESKLMKSLSDLAGKDLEKELLSIGFCEVGNAVITKGYNLKVKNIIFLPYKDKENPDEIIDFIFLHKAFRSAFNLATLYGLKKLATVPIPIGRRKQGFLQRIFINLGLERQENYLPPNEIIDIATGILDEYNGEVEELAIYQ